MNGDTSAVDFHRAGDPKMTRASALALASTAFLVPLASTVGANPAPTNPRVLSWYAALRKPWFKPPDAVIPIAWTALESLLAFGAFRLLRSEPSPQRTRALALWAFNVTAIGGWSRLFFRHRTLPAATVAAAVMTGTGAAFVAQARTVDRPAAAAGVPFVGWVAFATVLTASLWALNRRS